MADGNGKRQVDNPTVVIVRHGKTAFNQGHEEDRLKGTKFDLPLTDEGRRQAKKDADKLCCYDVASIEHSGMLRGEQTAEAIADATGVRSTSSAALDPWDVGYLSGMRRKVAAPRIEYYIRNPHKPVPEGEAYEDWFEEYGGGLRATMARAKKKPLKIHVLITHSCGMLATEAIVAGLEASEVKPHTGRMPEPGRMMKLEWCNGKWCISDMD